MRFGRKYAKYVRQVTQNALDGRFLFYTDVGLIGINPGLIEFPIVGTLVV